MAPSRMSRQFFAGVMCGGAAMLAVSAAWPQNAAQSLDAYMSKLTAAPTYLDPALTAPARDFMQRMMAAHHRRDAAAEIAELADDYAYLKVSEDGPVTLAESRDMAKRMTETLYQSEHMKNYFGVEATPIAIIGSIVVQLEVERFQFPNGAREQMTHLSIYETTGGKLRRLWAFSPEPEPAK